MQIVSLFYELKCRCFKSQACRFIEVEHDVHVLHGLTYGTFQEVIDARGDEQLIAVLLDMHQCLIGVHHLLQIYWLVAIVGEGCSLVEVLIDLNHILYRGWCLDNGGTEDATGKVTTIGDEVDVGIKITLYLFQRLTDLSNVLMLEGFIDAALTATSSLSRFR